MDNKKIVLGLGVLGLGIIATTSASLIKKNSDLIAENKRLRYSVDSVQRSASILIDECDDEETLKRVVAQQESDINFALIMSANHLA